MSVINVAFDLANTEELEIPVDRWGEPNFTIQLSSGGVPTVEGSTDRINRGETPTYFSLGTQPAAPSQLNFAGPLEVIRITGGTGGSIGRVMQSGASTE